MLVGNKCDRVTEREVSTQEGSALARELGCDFVEASAKNCVNVEKAFYDVVRQLRRQRQQPYKEGGHKTREKGKANGNARGYNPRPQETYKTGRAGGGGGGRTKNRGHDGQKCVIL